MPLLMHAPVFFISTAGQLYALWSLQDCEGERLFVHLYKMVKSCQPTGKGEILFRIRFYQILMSAMQRAKYHLLDHSRRGVLCVLLLWGLESWVSPVLLLYLLQLWLASWEDWLVSAAHPSRLLASQASLSCRGWFVPTPFCWQAAQWTCASLPVHGCW